MADSVMTAPPGKSGIRLKREIWTWTGMRTTIAQVVERRARNPEVRGSNPGSGSNFSLGISSQWIYVFLVSLVGNKCNQIELDKEATISGPPMPTFILTLHKKMFEIVFFLIICLKLGSSSLKRTNG